MQQRKEVMKSRQRLHDKKKLTMMEPVQFQEHILIVELLKERQQKLHALGKSLENRSEATLTTWIRICLERKLWFLQAFRNHNWDEKITTESLEVMQCKERKSLHSISHSVSEHLFSFFSGFPFSASNLIKQADCKWKIRWWYSFKEELSVVRPGKSEIQKEPQRIRIL